MNKLDYNIYHLGEWTDPASILILFFIRREIDLSGYQHVYRGYTPREKRFKRNVIAFAKELDLNPPEKFYSHRNLLDNGDVLEVGGTYWVCLDFDGNVWEQAIRTTGVPKRLRLIR